MTFLLNNSLKQFKKSCCQLNFCCSTHYSSTSYNKSYLSTYPNSQCVGIFRQQRGTNDPPFVLGFLKVRVGEEEEHLAELKERVKKWSETEK